MLWQEIQTNDGTVVGFGSPHKVLPTSRIIKIKSLVKMHKRLKQPKSFVTFNGGNHWESFAEMFQFDPNWNGTMTRGGWTIHNIHLLDELIQMAMQEYVGLINSNVPNYFNKNRHSVRAYYNARAQGFLKQDPTLTAAQLTARCQALYNASHQRMMDHRAQQFIQDPSVRFLDFWSPVADARPFKRQRPNQGPSQAASSSDGAI